MKIRIPHNKLKIFYKIKEAINPKRFGQCDYCPIKTSIRIYKKEIGTSNAFDCGTNCEKILDYFKIENLPKEIHEPGSGVWCERFSKWFYNIEIKTRYNTKI